MDISETTGANSAQQNYDDYLGGKTRTVTISKVSAGTSEQPVDIHLEEFPGHPYKPSKSMRRVLLSAWGPNAASYVGRKLTLYGDPTVKFGSAVVGGIKISHLSHIDKTLSIALTVSRGKRAPHTVKPLSTGPDAPTDTSGRDWLSELAQTEGDVDLINALGQAAKNANAGDTVLGAIRDAYKAAKDAGQAS